MRKTRMRIIPDDRWDLGMLESWLEDEAASGWLLVSGGTRFANFERTEPRKCRMRLEPAVSESLEVRAEKAEAYKELGWERICELGDYQVSVCFDPAAPELQTDPVAESWALEKLLKKQRRWNLAAWPLLLVVYGFLAWALLREDLQVETLLRGDWPAVLLTMALLPLAVWDTVRSIRGVRALRRQMQAGLPRSHGGNWKRSRRLAVAGFTLYIVIESCILGYPVYQSFTDWSARLDQLPEPAPYLAGEVLDPTLTEALRDGGYCRRESSFLEPHWYHTAEVWNSADARLDTDCSILRFRFLAELLYGEWAEDIRVSFPDTCAEMDHPGFDHLLLADTPGGTMLAACRGRAVLRVQAVGVDGVEEHLDDYAVMLQEYA